MNTALDSDDARRTRSECDWYGCDLDEQRWRLQIPEDVIAELEELLRERAGEDVQAVCAALGAARLPQAARFLAGVRERLLGAEGVVVAGRLPVERWSAWQRQLAVGALATLLAPMMEQTRSGVLLYHVRDTGLRLGHGVRRSLTNLWQPFHTDGPWVPHPAWVVGLHCLQTADTGGVSRCLSLRALYGDLEATWPQLGRRLRDDFFWDRQSEHGESEAPVSRQPMVWEEEGAWCARLYSDYVVNGYRLAGETMDPEADEALERIAALCGDPSRWLEFTLAAGEIEWVNNRCCAHARTGFPPSDQVRRQRHLVRTWHRLAGARGLDA